MQIRKGEEEQVRFRTDRFFRVGEEWFIATREGADIGPFKSREAAESAVPRYIKELKNNPADFARKIAVEGLWASTMYS